VNVESTVSIPDREPVVDALVLAFLTRMTFNTRDMGQTRRGRCRLYPQLARAVVSSCQLGQATVDAGAKEWRALLVEGIRA